MGGLCVTQEGQTDRPKNILSNIGFWLLQLSGQLSSGERYAPWATQVENKYLELGISGLTLSLPGNVSIL